MQELIFRFVPAHLSRIAHILRLCGETEPRSWLRTMLIQLCVRLGGAAWTALQEGSDKESHFPHRFPLFSPPEGPGQPNSSIPLVHLSMLRDGDIFRASEVSTFTRAGLATFPHLLALLTNQNGVLRLPSQPPLAVALLMPALAHSLTPRSSAGRGTEMVIWSPSSHAGQHHPNPENEDESSSASEDEATHGVAGGARLLRHGSPYPGALDPVSGLPNRGPAAQGRVSRLGRIVDINKTKSWFRQLGRSAKSFGKIGGRLGRWQRKRKVKKQERYVRDRMAEARRHHDEDVVSPGDDEVSDSDEEPEYRAESSGRDAGHFRHASSGQGWKKAKKNLKTIIKKAQRRQTREVKERENREMKLAKKQVRKGKGGRKKQLPKFLKLHLARQLKLKDLALGANSDLYDVQPGSEGVHAQEMSFDPPSSLDSDELQASTKGLHRLYLQVWLTFASLGLTPSLDARIPASVLQVCRGSFEDILALLDQDPLICMRTLTAQQGRGSSQVSLSDFEVASYALAAVFPSLARHKESISLSSELEALAIVKSWLSAYSIGSKGQRHTNSLVNKQAMLRHLHRYLHVDAAKLLLEKNPTLALYTIGLFSLEITRARSGITKGMLLHLADPNLEQDSKIEIAGTLSRCCFSTFLEHVHNLGRGGAREVLLIDTWQYLICASAHRCEKVREHALRYLVRLASVYPSILWNRSCLQTQLDLIELIANQLTGGTNLKPFQRAESDALSLPLKDTGYYVDATLSVEKMRTIFAETLHFTHSALTLGAELAPAEIRMLVQNQISRLNITTARLGRASGSPFGEPQQLVSIVSLYYSTGLPSLHVHQPAGNPAAQGSSSGQASKAGPFAKASLSSSVVSASPLSAHTLAQKAAGVAGISISLGAIAPTPSPHDLLFSHPLMDKSTSPPSSSLYSLSTPDDLVQLILERSWFAVPPKRLRAVGFIPPKLDLRKLSARGAASKESLLPYLATRPSFTVLNPHATSFTASTERRAHFLGQVEGMYVFWTMTGGKPLDQSNSRARLPSDSSLDEDTGPEHKDTRDPSKKTTFLRIMKKNSIKKLNSLLTMYRRLSRMDPHFTTGSPYQLTQDLSGDGASPFPNSFAEDSEIDETILWDLLDETLDASKPFGRTSTEKQREGKTQAHKVLVSTLRLTRRRSFLLTRERYP